MELPPLTTWLVIILGTAVPAFLLSWIAAWMVRRVAPRLGLIDRPGERKNHTTATPLGGGLAIWVGMVGFFALLWLLAVVAGAVPSIGDRMPDLFRTHREGMVSKGDSLWVLLGAGTVLMLLGLADDRRGLDWRLRISVQFAVAIACVAWQGWRITAFINIPLLTALLSVIWIVSLINAFNMLDNMDGLSGGVAAIAAGTLAVVLLLTPESGTGSPQLFVAAFLLVMVGALLGFLAHNLPPARLFMGDAGSYLIGFSIAVATLLATYTGYHSSRPHAIMAPIYVMAVPFYDMVSVIVIRIREGRSPFHADRNHFSHRLTDLGLSRFQAVLTIYLLTATCGLGALLLHRVDRLGAILITLMIVCVLALIAILETTARRRIRA